ncbi:MAG: SpoIVB peptidase S55, partial [Terracidiphilus sp.]
WIPSQPWILPGHPIRRALPVLALAAAFVLPFLPACAQPPAAPGNTPPAALKPPQGGGFFPLSQVHRGLQGTAWTVFTGTAPVAMQVEILGVLHGALGPGQDMILARLLGAKPEYTGVVAGMSGSPVYIGNRLLGALSYRIGEFSKEPIAGITPIEQMLQVRNLPLPEPGQGTSRRQRGTAGGRPEDEGGDSLPPDPLHQPIRPMETPLVMSGFRPAAIRLWQEKMLGTALATVAPGGMDASSATLGAAISRRAIAGIEPGSAVAAQLVRGDMEIAAICTVTYMDPRQLLACGHPLLRAGPVSLPMTTAEVVTTLASPMNSFKIVNTGTAIGSFDQDREAGIRGLFGVPARMIPVRIRLREAGRQRTLHVQVLDLPALTPRALLQVVYEALLETNDSTAETSYHLTGSIDLDGYAPSPIDLWTPAGESMTAPIDAALAAAEQFARLYLNGARRGAVRAVDLDVEAIPHNLEVTLAAARLVSGDMAHAGDTVVVEATLRPWQQPEHRVRMAVKLPDRLEDGDVKLLVSDAGTLDHLMNRTAFLPQMPGQSVDLQTELAEARGRHAANRIYVSLLVPEAQASLEGQTLSSLPLSMANALEPLRASRNVLLYGESAQVEAEAPAGGILSGYAVLNLRIRPGGGLN